MERICSSDGGHSKHILNSGRHNSWKMVTCKIKEIEGNIKMHLSKTGCEYIKWIELRAEVL
jgi:hypothetical protein